MTAHNSAPQLLALHAVRLQGMADADQVATRFHLDAGEVSEWLLDFEAFGWLSHAQFGATGGWTLTSRGRAQNEQQLRDELDGIGAREVVQDAYTEFLPFNAQLLRACTQWQLRPTAMDPLAPNDHRDAAWDERVLAVLASLGGPLRRTCTRLGSRLSRFQGYEKRYWAAVSGAQRGEQALVARPRADSCHTVWMELHEDLLATLGIERGAEPIEAARGTASASGPEGQ